MNDRQYVKVNTSIQTASNASHINTDDEGNKEATLELRLPDNLFPTSQGAMNVDSVSMLTTKFRLSMENTPIAQLPLDTDKTTEKTIVSKCQLDVYPFCYTDDEQIQPDPRYIAANVAFPNYKNHLTTYNIRLADFTNPDAIQYHILETYQATANTEGYGFPQHSKFYSLVQQLNISERVETHMMNLTMKTNHEPPMIENGSVFIKSLGALEQILEDALENAITYAMTSNEITVTIDLVPPVYPADLSPPLPVSMDDRIKVESPGRGLSFAWYWKTAIDQRATCSLNYAIKPKVRIGEQSLTISYDTAPFDNMIPILWTNGYVETYDTPEQMSLDTLRNVVWNKPPPKRQYKYGATTSESGTFDYTLIEGLQCAPMNIICNKEMRDAFSFLPWIPVDTSKFEAFGYGKPPYKYQLDITKVIDKSTQTMNNKYISDTGHSDIYWHRTTVIYSGDSYQSKPTLYIRYYAPLKDQEDTSEDPEWETDDTSGWTDIRITGGGEVTSTNEVALTYSYNQQTRVDPTVTESFTSYTNEGDYTPGTSTSTDTHPSGEGSYTQTEYENGLGIFYDYINPYDPESEENPATYQIGKHLDGTFRASSVQFYSKWIPSRAADIQTVDPIVYDLDGIKYRYIEARWYLVQDLPDHVVHLNASSTSAFDVHNTTTSTSTTTVTTTTVTLGNPHPELTLTITPNIPLSNGKFYILDGTSAEVTIGQPELIGNKMDVTYDTKYIKTTDVVVENGEKKTNSSVDVYSGPASFQDPIPSVLSYQAGLRHDEYEDKHATRQIPGCIYYRFYCLKDNYNFLTGGTGNLLLSRLFALYDTETPVMTAIFHLNQTLLWGGTYFDREGGTEPYVSNMTPYQTEPYSVAPEHTVEGTDDPVTPGTTIEETKIETFKKDGVEVDAPAPDARHLRTETIYLGRFDKDSYNIDPADPGNNYPSYLLDLSQGVYGEYWTWDTDYANIKLIPNGLQEDNVRFVTTRGSVLDMYDKYEVYIMLKHYYPPGRDPTCDPEQIPSEFYNHAIRDASYTGGLEYELLQYQTRTTISVVENNNEYGDLVGNVRLSFNWDNLPMVVMSPIASIVLTMAGIQLNQEYQPVNATNESATNAALTSTIPIVENYYSLASTLRDLHDELVVIKDSFNDQATYTLATTSGQERTLTLSAKYITKDGTVHQIYIPPNGVFSIQLTFGISYYLSS